MFSNNNEISKLQMKRLLILDLFATTILIVPGLAAKESGKAGVISIVIGCLLSLIYAVYILKISSMYSDNYYNFMKRCAPKFLAWIFMIVYAIKFLISFVFVLRLFTEVIQVTFLTDMSEYVLAIAMLLVAGFGAIKGIEVRGRIGELMFYVVLLPILIIILLSVSEIRTENLLPVFTDSESGVVSGGYLVFTTFSVLELLLFISPFVRGRKYIYKSVTGAILCMSAILILLFVASVGIFTTNGVVNDRWSTVILMQVVKMPGGFLSRQDGLMLAFWMGSVFILLSGYLFYLNEITKNLLGTRRNNRTIIGCWMFIVIVVFCICNDFSMLFEKYMQFLAYISMPAGILIPGLFAVIHIFKQRGRRHEKV